MKPVKVTMQAFGPYLTRTACDFSLLRDNRLFLISGPTGGGKTAILDAISFALYGTATGSLRDFRDMRSLSAPLELDTAVEYEFTLRDQRYRFTRTLHLHQKRTGGIDEQMDAVAERWDKGSWSLLESGSREVPRLAQELIGFTGPQFSQVVVLPQGEFRKLLVANSTEKMRLLQVLFGTGRWQKLTERMGARVKTLEGELKEAGARRAALLGQAGCETAEQLSALLAEWREKEIEARNRAGEQNAKARALSEQFGAAQRLAADFDALTKAKEQKQELEEQAAVQEQRKRELARLSAAAGLLPYHRALREAAENAVSCREKKEASEKAFALAQERLLKAEAMKKEMPALEESAARLEERLQEIKVLLPMARERAQTREKLEAVKKLEADALQEQTDLEAKIQGLEARVETGKKWLKNEYETVIVHLPEWTAQSQASQQKLAALEGLREAEKKQKALCAAYENLQKEETAAREELSAAQEQLQRVEEILSQNTAAALAGNLRDGEPCPVCGSPAHPSPARPGPDAPKEAGACRRFVEECREAREAARTRLAALAEKLKSAGLEVERFQSELGEEDPEGLPAKAASLARQAAEGQKRSGKYGRGRTELERMQGDLSAARREAEEAQKRLNGLREERAGLASLLARTGSEDLDAAQLQEEQTALLQKQKENKAKREKAAQEWQAVSRDHAGAQAALFSAQDAFAAAAQRETTARAAFDAARQEGKLPEGDALKALFSRLEEKDELERQSRAYEDALAAATEQIALLSHQTRDKERPDLDALRTLLETQNAEADQCALEWGALKQRVKDLTKTAAMIQTEIADIAQTEAEYGKLARIYRYCAGNNPAKTPLSNFVLGLLLDDVMEEASRYLSRLSGDRYALVRVDAAGGNAYRGLDIEVMDAYKGGRRKVGTLSGGELFLASLSLAFGLAQVVQSYAGGIQLDSLFIDEGFGTLDGDTLDAAMAALGEIEKSGRMVGLISHVGELKTRIFARIEVYPGENGAKLKVIG